MTTTVPMVTPWQPFSGGTITVAPSGSSYSWAPGSIVAINQVDVPYATDFGFQIAQPQTIASNATIVAGGTVTSISPISTPAAANATNIVNGGTAVTVFNANSIINLGLIQNPGTNANNLFINLVTTATTLEGGLNFAIQPGAAFRCPPSTLAVSANSIDSGHTFDAVIF